MMTKYNKPSLTWTEGWIEKIVVGLGLCPFAAIPFKKKQIRLVSFSGDDLVSLLELLKAECNYLLVSDPEKTETTLIVIEDTLSTFEEYLNFVTIAESLMDQLNLEGILQLATFHPEYRFGDSAGENDPSDYTNRSPFPMLHLLREESVSRAVDSYPDIDEVPQRNILRMQQLGTIRIQQMLEDIKKSF
ncbi:MAG: DUF1415 domain-containing protein [Saprospiraceae bacterium]|nr:DUF1415 domain-containing protein [Saprospiraceae bacterium]